jgi:predicted RNA binding protein YcfA (HicA-like mRNA interferase family)
MKDTSEKQPKDNWPAVKAKRLLAALQRIGWNVKRQTGSHRTLEKVGFEDCLFAFHDSDEVGPIILRKVARRTGLKPEDL